MWRINTKWILLIAVVTATVLGYFSKKPREKISELSSGEELAISDVPISQAKDEDVSVKSLPSESPSLQKNIHPNDSALGRVEQDLARRDAECIAAARKLFSSKESFDVKGKWFQSPEAVIEKLHDTYRETLLSEESHESYRLMRQSGRDKFEKSSVVCRPSQSLRFISTVFDAYNELKWDDASRQEILYVVGTMTEKAVGDNFSPINTQFVYHTLKSLAAKGLVPSSEHKKIERSYEAFENDKRAGRLASFSAQEERAKEALALLQTMKKRHAPLYD